MECKELIQLVEQMFQKFILDNQIDQIFKTENYENQLRNSIRISPQFIKSIILYSVFKFFKHFFQKSVDTHLIHIHLFIKQFQRDLQKQRKSYYAFQKEFFFQFIITTKLTQTFINRYLPSQFQNIDEELIFVTIIFLIFDKLISSKSYSMLNKSFTNKEIPIKCNQISKMHAQKNRKIGFRDTQIPVDKLKVQLRDALRGKRADSAQVKKGRNLSCEDETFIKQSFLYHKIQRSVSQIQSIQSQSPLYQYIQKQQARKFRQNYFKLKRKQPEQHMQIVFNKIIKIEEGNENSQVLDLIKSVKSFSLQKIFENKKVKKSVQEERKRIQTIKRKMAQKIKAESLTPFNIQRIKLK